MSKPLHALVNSGLMLACLCVLYSPLKPSLKFSLVLCLGIGAQRHAMRQELLVKHYTQAFRTASNASLSECQLGLNWLKGYFPEPTNEKPKGMLQRIALDGWQELAKSNNPVPALYAAFQRQYIAFGMNDDPKFAPTWLGIPELDELPDNDIRTGSFKGKAQDLEAFLDRAIALLEQRIEDTSRTPPVLVIVDELTHQLRELDEKTRERVVVKLDKLATQGDKHGLFVWIILHTITKEESCLDRVFLRQFHLIIGVELSQDRTVLSNAPRILPPQAIVRGQEQYRLHGLRAGFVTSLPIADGFLPAPPLPDGLVGLERDWGDAPANRLQTLFAEQVQQSEVIEAIRLYRIGQLPKNGEKPKPQLFRLVWGYPLNGQRQAELKILNRHLEQLAAAVVSKNGNDNGHHPVSVS
jgi:hypothetical protein